MYDYESTALQEEDLDSLEHYGIKGQKWGQRRYQNPDGSYTELGKERRRVGYEDDVDAKKEKDANANANGIEATESTDMKFGGKAYKDMTRKELRAAKKRARHNEKERRAQREFNRDKREAIENGDISFISENISKFSNDEIDEAVVRYKRMQTIKDLEATQKKSSDAYIDKALRFLDKASQATNSVTNIYNKINESQQRSIQKKKMEAEYDKLINPKKSEVEKKKEKLELEKINKELDELRNGKKKTETEILKEQYELEKAQKDLAKLRDPDLFKTKEEIYKEEKAIKDLEELRNGKKKTETEILKEQYELEKAQRDLAYLIDPSLDPQYVNSRATKESARRSQEEIERQNREKANALELQNRIAQEKAELEKLEREMKQNKKSSNKLSEEIENLRRESMNDRVSREMSELYDEDMPSWFGSSEKKQKLGGWFSKKNKEDVKGTDFDLDDKRVNSINKKYSNQLKKTTEEDYWKENPTRNKQWKKEYERDLKRHKDDVIDNWIKDMKKKYMKEQNLSSREAEEKAEDYVDSWLDAYDEGLV